MSQLAYRKYGMGPGPAVAPVTPIGSGLTNGAVTPDGTGKLSPDNPMLWLLGIGAATLGLIAVNTSIRVGPFKASASV